MEIFIPAFIEAMVDLYQLLICLYFYRVQSKVQPERKIPALRPNAILPVLCGFWARQGNAWVELTGLVNFQADLLSFYNHHPVLGEYLQTIRFEPQWLDAIRIEVVSPEEGKPWTLSELRVGVLEDG